MTIDHLRDYGISEMDASQVRDFLTNRGFGVLGLETGGAPYLLPMSFGYDGESRLYFSYVVDGDSRKRALTDQADEASFLAFTADTTFTWESVFLEGTIERVPDEMVADLGDVIENAWDLHIFRREETPGQIAVYEFEVLDQSGIRCVGLPPEMEEYRPEVQ